MRRLRIARLAVAALAAAALASPAVTAEPPPTLTAIGLARDASGTTVTLSGDADLRYEYFLVGGTSLVIDLDAEAGPGLPAEQALDDPLLGRIRVAPRSSPRERSRVVLDLRGAARFTVRGAGPRIMVVLAEGDAPANPGPAADAPRPSGPLVTAVEGVPRTGAFDLPVRGNTELDFRVEEVPDPRLVALLLPGAAIGPSVAAAMDYAALGGNVQRVSIEPLAGPAAGARVLIRLRETAPFRLSRTGTVVTVSLADPAHAAGAAASGLEADSQDPQPLRPFSGEGGSYEGARISLDFVDSDLFDIFRLLAEVSGFNIVASDDVKGRRSIHMNDIPWDQALDLILATNTPKLTRVRETGNVIRITTLKRIMGERLESERARLELTEIAARKKAIEKEAEAARTQADWEERRRTEPLELRTFSLSYADAATLAERLKQYRSDRPDGLFEFDERSNMIVVQDVGEKVATMSQIVALVDHPTPTVMVEARIVEVLSDFSQAIGVQWGGAYRADAAHGNATGYAFPNSVAVGGSVEQGADGINPGTYLVNLPAANPVAGVGLSLGHIANTASLDIRLSALEKMGKTKILSNPKILVIQNENAKINVGSQLPVPKTDAEGNRTVEWKDVGILLQVKPHITYDRRVFMDLSIEKSSRGETVRTTEGEMFSIETRNAVTKVLVGDGETSVIGGIYIESTTEGESGVPWFRRLPVIGWLFKSRSSLADRKELMIFLTPRITVPRSPILP